MFSDKKLFARALTAPNPKTDEAAYAAYLDGLRDTFALSYMTARLKNGEAVKNMIGLAEEAYCMANSMMRARPDRQR